MHFSPHVAEHLKRTDGFAHVPDISVGSFYQTQPFILHPEQPRVPDEPLIGAPAVHHALKCWRRQLNEPTAQDAAVAR